MRNVSVENENKIPRSYGYREGEKGAGEEAIGLELTCSIGFYVDDDDDDDDLRIYI